MPFIRTDLSLDGVPIIRMESALLRVDVAPGVGGRIVSLFHKSLGREFLWRNPALPLRRELPGTPYDPSFYGGIDEVLPNDLPEPVNGRDSPDHGELWTAPLEAKIEDDRLVLGSWLPICGLFYERRMRLHETRPLLFLDYRIANLAPDRRHFLWRIHAALAASPGDRIACPARTGRLADPAWSRFQTTEPFAWPWIGKELASVLPQQQNTCDFFCLSDFEGEGRGSIGLVRPTFGVHLSFEFNVADFPHALLFVSHGGLLGHYVAVLEPCTVPTVSVREALAEGTCSALAPGAELRTTVSIRAGALEGAPNLGSE